MTLPCFVGEYDKYCQPAPVPYGTLSILYRGAGCQLVLLDVDWHGMKVVLFIDLSLYCRLYPNMMWEISHTLIRNRLIL